MFNSDEWSELISKSYNIEKKILKLNDNNIIYFNSLKSHFGELVSLPAFGDFIEYNINNKELIDSKVDSHRDYLIDFFGFKTLEKSYLLKSNHKIRETPQYLYMRVALCIHRDNLEKAFETYDMISNKYFIHATPTLFNAGTNHEQLASCFLLSMKEDSISGIYDTLKCCALISLR